MSNIYNAIQNLYNMDKTTWQEVLAEMYNLVSNVENKFDLFENKFGSLLGEEVTKELKKMYNNGSLTSLINDKLLKDINTKVDAIANKTLNKINALSIGFKNDGVSDNLQAINNFINTKSNSTLYFPNGTYCFSNGFDFKENLFIELDNKAELKLISQNNIDNFITLNLTKTQGYSYGNFIKGNGIINGNFKCNNLIGLSYYRHLSITGVILKNFNK